MNNHNLTWHKSRILGVAYLEFIKIEIENNRPNSKFCLATVTLKQGLRTYGLFQSLNCQTVTRVVSEFLHKLNRKVFKNAYRRYGKRLVCIPSIETSINDRLHVHMVLEIPQYMTFEDFIKYVDTIWDKNPWAMPEKEIIEMMTKSDQSTSTKYLLKDSWKDVDIIDVENLYLGRTIH